VTEVAKDLQDDRAQSDGPSLWRQRDFMLLWSGQTVSEMGSAVTQVALPLVAVVALKASTFLLLDLSRPDSHAGVGLVRP
jgi:hypothetical protein